MPDGADIRRVAADHFEHRGPYAVDWLREQAELAYGQGDADAADTWREIAEAARHDPAVAFPLAAHSSPMR
jgi:hypothetical protein